MLPEEICVEVLRELWIHVDNVDITLFRVADRRFVVIACLILLERDA